MTEWHQLEQQLPDVGWLCPPMGSPFTTDRTCPAVLGRMWCTKRHQVDEDPVHVCGHPDYGVVAVWIAGFDPQVSGHLARKCGPSGLVYLFGRAALPRVVVVEPPEAHSCE